MTSISILVITLGLLPVQSLVADLKVRAFYANQAKRPLTPPQQSEEFFRVLSRRKSGVPLASINAISTPSFGILDSISVLLRRHCSPYFGVSFVTGLLLLATSTLAPASCKSSVNTHPDDQYSTQEICQCLFPLHISTAMSPLSQ